MRCTFGALRSGRIDARRRGDGHSCAYLVGRCRPGAGTTALAGQGAHRGTHDRAGRAARPDSIAPIAAWWLAGDGTLATLRAYALAVPSHEPDLPPMIALLPTTRTVSCTARSSRVERRCCCGPCCAHGGCRCSAGGLTSSSMCSRIRRTSIQHLCSIRLPGAASTAWPGIRPGFCS